MKTETWWNLISCLLLFIFASGTSDVFAQREPQTVVEYYLLLPAKYLTIGGSRDERLSVIKINDARNGYLRIEGAWEGYTEIALFRKPDRSYIVAVSDVHFGPGPDQKLYFLEYRNNKWTDITQTVLPEISDRDIADAYRDKRQGGDEDFGEEVPYLYRLPRVGTTLTIITAPGLIRREIILMELKWTEGRFESVLPPVSPPSFAGNWSLENKTLSFDLTLKQIGNVIKGTYSYVTLPDATRIREGIISGVVKDNVAEINFENSEYSAERGKAIITMSKGRLVWQITQPPEEESRLPTSATLDRRK